MRRSFHGVKSLGAAILALVCFAVLAFMASNSVSGVGWDNLVSWRARTPAPLANGETTSPGFSASIQTTYSPNVKVSDWVSDQIAGMSLAQKIGQVLVVAVDGYNLTEDTCQYIQELAPGGIFLRPDNVFEPGQLRRFSAGLQGCMQPVHAVPLLIALDHEGQYANRFHEGVTTFPNAIAQGATGDPNVAYRVARAAGQELAYSGVNMVFGPVADVQLNLDNKVIAKRTFGGDPAQVSQFVAQAVQGYQQAGLIPVLKHYPGHGGVAEDSHKTLPVDGIDLAGLRAGYLPTFRSGIEAGAPAVMLSHVAFPQIFGSELPTSLSPEGTNILREELGFQGVVVTDALDMKAVAGKKLSIPKAALQSLQAGSDLLLLTTPEDALATAGRLQAAVQEGELPIELLDAAVRRVLELKAGHGLAELARPPEMEPDWEAHAILAQEIGKRSVALFKNKNNLVPIPKEMKRLLVVGPNSEWDFQLADLDAPLKERGFVPEYVTYAPPRQMPSAEKEYLQSLPQAAKRYDLILVLTYQAHINKIVYQDTWQIQLVQNLVRTGRPLVVAAIGSPTDFIDIKEAPVFLATFGTTPGALEALLDILIGRLAPEGHSPFPGLP